MIMIVMIIMEDCLWGGGGSGSQWKERSKRKKYASVV
jgi:hypothetical protein